MSRQCPFCGVQVKPELFACSTHWSIMGEENRAAIWEAYRNYQANSITLGQFKQIQQEVLDDEGGAMYDAMGNPVKKRDYDPAKELRAMATCWKRYLKQYKIYAAIKPQMLDERRRHGMVLANLTREMNRMADNTLNPPQPTLFDEAAHDPT